ncbi:MAG: hypothetical protein RSA90_06615 [Lachnospiraceae bacterium]
MEHRLPYYMVYPMPLQCEDIRIERNDYEYMKSLYPQVAKKILPYVEEECERLEYKGSMIYDAYPDKVLLHLVCERVYNQMNDWEEVVEKSLVEVMVYQEIYRRRCAHRQQKRDGVDV